MPSGLLFEIQFAGGFAWGLWCCSKHSQYLRTPAALVQDGSHVGPALVMNYIAQALPGTQGSLFCGRKGIKNETTRVQPGELPCALSLAEPGKALSPVTAIFSI